MVYVNTLSLIDTCPRINFTRALSSGFPPDSKSLSLSLTCSGPRCNNIFKASDLWFFSDGSQIMGYLFSEHDTHATLVRSSFELHCPIPPRNAPRLKPFPTVYDMPIYIPPFSPQSAVWVLLWCNLLKLMFNPIWIYRQKREAAFLPLMTWCNVTPATALHNLCGVETCP